ncbi:MAG: isocitrate lyase/phosphoenolpyruvate mutase family protein [Rhizobiaceae bacterium]|nr:isocitrate lyase/phosphoenolpyruvate mutase family protein [Rhizobiaceae bacterium]
MTSFRDLHVPGKPFILANAWDAGSAKILAALGAKAIATTSAGHAFTLGLKDMGNISRQQSLEHSRQLVEATNLPVSGDLENGYGHSPQDVATTIVAAAQAGLAGCCIEDTRLPTSEPYEFSFAVERIEAAIQAARSIEGDFVLAARADGVMTGKYNTDEAIRRLKAFEGVGADVLYAPLPPSLEELGRICKSVNAPVNALAAGKFAKYTVQDFANIGVARISLGSALSRVTHTAIINSARQMFENGDFSSFLGKVNAGEVEALFDQVKIDSGK